MSQILTIEEVFKAQEVLKDVARHPRLVPTKFREDAEKIGRASCRERV